MGYNTVQPDTPVTAQFVVNNLRITNVSVTGDVEADYILWDPDTNPQPRVVNFNLTDTQNGTAWVKLGIYDSAQNWVAGRVITVPRPTTGASITWDGRDLYGNLMPKGVYLFTLKACGESPNIPAYATDVYRSGGWGTVNPHPNVPEQESPWLAIGAVQFNTPPGYEQVAPPAQGHVRVWYKLVERFGKRAAQAYVLLFGPDLRVVAGPVVGGREVNTNANGAVWNRADVPFQPTEEGEYVFLVCAQDDERDRYKGHLPRWALQRGVKRLIPLAVNYDFQNYPNPPPAGTTPHAQRAANYQRNHPCPRGAPRRMKIAHREGEAPAELAPQERRPPVWRGYFRGSCSWAVARPDA
jgi:hypothetical protein